MFFGVLSLLMSFGKGLVFYIPALVLVLSRRVREMLQLDARDVDCVGCIGAAHPLYSSGGRGTAVPSGVRDSFSISARLLACLSPWQCRIVPSRGHGDCWSQLSWCCLPGLLSMATCTVRRRWMHAGLTIIPEYLCWYVPEFSALWRPFVTGSFWHMMSNVRWPYAAWNLLVVGYLLARELIGSLGRDPAPRPLSVAAKNSALP